MTSAPTPQPRLAVPFVGTAAFPQARSALLQTVLHYSQNWLISHSNVSMSHPVAGFPEPSSLSQDSRPSSDLQGRHHPVPAWLLVLHAPASHSVPGKRAPCHSRALPAHLVTVRTPSLPVPTLLRTPGAQCSISSVQCPPEGESTACPSSLYCSVTYFYFQDYSILLQR